MRYRGAQEPPPGTAEDPVTVAREGVPRPVAGVRRAPFPESPGSQRSTISRDGLFPRLRRGAALPKHLSGGVSPAPSRPL